MLEQFTRRCGLAEAVHTYDPTVWTRVSPPGLGDARLDDYARSHGSRKNGFAIVGILRRERIGAWHRHNTRLHAVAGEDFSGRNRQRNFRTGRDKNDVGLAVGIAQYVAAAHDTRDLI